MSERKKKPRRKLAMPKTNANAYTLMAPETDRGCVLVASELLSETLEQLFAAVFEKHLLSKSACDELLASTMSPLFSFGMRIKLARAFGLIRTDAADALEFVRKIRNLCAHGVGPVNLSDPDIKPLIGNLKQYCLERNPEFEVRYEKYGTLYANEDGNHWTNAGGDTKTYSPERYIFMDSIGIIDISIAYGTGMAMRGELLSPILQRQLFGRKKSPPLV